MVSNGFVEAEILLEESQGEAGDASRSVSRSNNLVFCLGNNRKPTGVVFVSTTSTGSEHSAASLAR